MICPVTVIKSMHISFKSLNNLTLLQRCYDVYESMYYFSQGFSISIKFFIIIAFIIGPKMNNSISKFLSCWLVT